MGSLEFAAMVQLPSRGLSSCFQHEASSLEPVSSLETKLLFLIRGLSNQNCSEHFPPPGLSNARSFPPRELTSQVVSEFLVMILGLSSWRFRVKVQWMPWVVHKLYKPISQEMPVTMDVFQKSET